MWYLFFIIIIIIIQRQESSDYLAPILTKLITSTSDLETNKFVLVSLLFKIWQQHQSPAGVYYKY